jgi:diacylglycerol O-acyltransferase
MMQPLEGMDAAFLSLETPTTPLHVGAVLVLDPPEGTRSLFSPTTRYAQIRRVISQRLHLVPPLRQRAVRVPLGLHHPVWVDDPDFELDDHLSRASLPAPGGRHELDAFVASVMSRQLDPDRPLWEMYLVEGLEGDRTALIAKVHHAILDGVSGASILAAFLDLSPRARVIDLPGEAWDPEPLPSATELVRYAATSLTHQPGVALSTLGAGVEAMADLGRHNRDLQSRGETPPPAFFSAPRTSINGAVSNRKRFSSLALPLEDVKLVRRVFECTVNDVILAGVAGGLRRLLADRGETPERSLVAMVPVSTRAAGEGEGEALGNQVSGMLVSLGTDIEDPVERLRAIAGSTVVAKEQELLHRGRLVGDLAQMAAPALVSRLARAVSGTRIFDHMRPPFNVTVSGVKGPEFPLFCAGSRVTALFPLGPIAEGIGLNVTILSYLDQLHFGLFACRRLVPELDELGVHIDDALGELVGCALDARGAVG